MVKPNSLGSACIIKGNPIYISTPLARSFYRDLETLLKSLGYKVSTDAGEEYTCPPVSDLYIAHSKGADRRMCMDKRNEDASRFIMVGSDYPGSINNPVDQQWMDGKPENSSWKDYGVPPPEHFILTKRMKDEIIKRVKMLNS